MRRRRKSSKVLNRASFKTRKEVHEFEKKKRIRAIEREIKIIFESKRRDKKKKSLKELLTKFKGKEDVLYQKVCKKYGIKPNRELLPQRKIITKSRKRGVQFYWPSFQECLEEVILMYQYSEDKQIEDAMHAEKLSKLILSFVGQYQKKKKIWEARPRRKKKVNIFGRTKGRGARCNLVQSYAHRF